MYGFFIMALTISGIAILSWAISKALDAGIANKCNMFYHKDKKYISAKFGISLTTAPFICQSCGYMGEDLKDGVWKIDNDGKLVPDPERWAELKK